MKFREAIALANGEYAVVQSASSRGEIPPIVERLIVERLIRRLQCSAPGPVPPNTDNPQRFERHLA